MLAPSLQEFFVDKEDGLPLVGGKVYFYKDSSRSSLKSVYELVDGGSENYSYAALENPLTLSAVGTIQDGSGNDVLPYYFPYDSNGIVELYYVVVTDADGTQQFVRAAWPNLVTQTQSTTNLDNFISNGQFSLHNNIFSSTATTTGQITANSTTIAPGGWIYERSAGATDSDFVVFNRINSYTQSPDQSPRYQVNISCTTAVNATTKYFIYRFNDVNKFSSSTQNYTFAFFGLSSSASTIQILTRKYFGTGGTPSSTVTTNIGSVNLTSSYPTSAYVISFTFGSNESYTLGTNNDDYVDVIISFPVSTTFNCKFSDMMLVFDTQTSVSFPVTTNNKFNYQALAGNIATPDYNGLSYYLPIINTPSGFAYDTSPIGCIIACLETTAPAGKLACDGSTYRYSKVSTDLIPYSRLGDKYWNSTIGEYITGMGLTYASACVGTGVTSHVTIFSNVFGTAGTVAQPTDGNTGLSFLTNFAANASGFSVNAYLLSTLDGLNVRGTVAGAVTVPDAKTSGFTISDARNNSQEKHSFSVTTTSAAGLGGKYWTMSSTTTNYYIWYQVNSVGADPAPGGTGIKVNVNTSDSIFDVGYKTSAALNGGYGSTITVLAAASMTASSYFTFGTANGSYFVWFTLDGVGTQPNPGASYVAIPVALTTGQTAAQVAVLVRNAINRVCYGVPDLRGLVLRGLDPNLTYDSVGNIRTPALINGTSVGSVVGGLEYTRLLYHIHTATTTSTATGGSIPTTSVNSGGANNNPLLSGAATTFSRTFDAEPTIASTTTVASSGGGDMTMYNYSVNYFVNY